ncbi:MAG: hypothetical protein AMS25_15260 [Gemmatimonas sp. SM23_52]|nr:MAG: hypothetical protein AMS25_15260 [Gemmatimonas sp. SM23_52]
MLWDRIMRAIILAGLVLVLRATFAFVLKPVLPGSLRSVYTLVRLLRLDIAGVSLLDLLM